MFAASH